MTIALGLDAGRDTGAAIIQLAANGRAKLLASRVLWRDGRIVDLLAILAEHPDIELVATEAPAGFPFKGRDGAAAHLIEAAKIGGELAGACQARGLPVVTTTANIVRKALCRRSGATDAEVKAMLRVRLELLPHGTNDHERDAMAVAIWAAMTAKHERARRAGGR